jgi:hypothetical protein
MPILYTNENEKPYKKKSRNERDVFVAVGGGNSAGWRNNTFNLDGNISAGDYIWFGIYAGWFTTRFDYGGICYKGWFDWDLYPDYEGEPPPYMNISTLGTFCTIRWSMYFNYTAITSQNFVRTLTQGVGLSDNKLLSADYKRSTTQTAKVNSNLSKYETFYRKLQEAVKCKSNVSSSVLFTRIMQETAKVKDTLNQWCAFFRGLIDTADIKTESEAKQGYIFTVKLIETVKVTGFVFRGLLLFVSIASGVFIRDYLLGRFLKARSELVLKSQVTCEITLESKI